MFQTKLCLNNKLVSPFNTEQHLWQTEKWTFDFELTDYKDVKKMQEFKASQ